MCRLLVVVTQKKHVRFFMLVFLSYLNHQRQLSFTGSDYEAA